MFSASNGKKLLIFLSIFIVFFHLIFMGTSLFMLKDANTSAFLYLIIQNAFTIVLEIVLLVLMYKGFEWAKWLVNTLLFVIGFMSLVPYNQQKPTLPSIIMGIFLIIIGILLFFSPSIKLFLAEQREHKNSNTTS